MIKPTNEERAREMQRQYLREWRKKNKDKVRGYNNAYWMRKADAEAKEEHDGDAIPKNS